MFGLDTGNLSPKRTRTLPERKMVRVIHLIIGFILVLVAVMLLPLPRASSHNRLAATNGSAWLVANNQAYDSYSNGLRVENTERVSSTQRFYQILDRNHDLSPSPMWYSEPVGILYHLTETEPDLASDRVLRNVRDLRSYHFFVDRGGRAWRVVEELDVANHAGNSIWASGPSVYVNLNNSFVGIGFEGRTLPAIGTDLTPEQIQTGRLLTEVLRTRFRIPAENCVTHAQVSVNPENLRVGYHTDGANRFPFEPLGLPDNYSLPPASVSEFGFKHDQIFRAAMGSQSWQGLEAAERTLVQNASQNQVTPEEYRRTLQQKYRRLFSTFKLTGALDEP